MSGLQRLFAVTSSLYRNSQLRHKFFYCSNHFTPAGNYCAHFIYEGYQIVSFIHNITFLALSPVFMIFTSNLILGERLDKFGIIGILVTTIGAYLLHVNTTKHGILEPFKAILRERGSLYMIIVAFIYSITSNLGKMAILHSSPLFFAAVYFPVLSVILFPILMWKNHGDVKQLFSQFNIFSLIGLVVAFAVITHLLAVSIIEVPYVISVKRTSLLFGIMYGAIWFKETNIRERLIGGIIMIVGISIITLF